MSKRYVLLVMFSLLWTSFMLVPVQVLDIAEASGTILIDEDGKVVPSTAPIQRYGTLYVLTDNIYDSVVVARSNITVDGNGHTVQGLGSGEGFWLDNTNGVTIKNTTIRGFSWGIYLESISGYEIRSNTISGNTLTNNSVGVRFFLSSGNTISENIITKNNVAAEFDHSDANAFSVNNITENRDGVWIVESSDNNLYGNNIRDNEYDGIQLVLSSGNTINGNSITNSSDGVGLGSSDRNTVLFNDLNNGDNGAVLYNSYYNTISGNNLTNNKMSGVQLTFSYDNQFYHNNFVDNAQQTLSDESMNSWDDGYPYGGNFWSDYVGNDTNSGPDQDETGCDGIGDVHYVIDEYNQDFYPIINPIGSPQPPIAAFSHTPEEPFRGQLITFDADASYDRDGSITNYRWDFGDDNVTTVTTTTVNHIYTAPGNYTANLSVTDGDNLSHNTSKTIAVLDDATPPTTMDDYDDSWYTTDFSVTLTATDDKSGVAETYYRINQGSTKTLSGDGQPQIAVEGYNNTLTYWSVDNAGNDELPKILTGIRLDKTSPTIGTPLRIPSGDVQPETEVKISANVTDMTSGVKNVSLYYRQNTSSWSHFSMTFDSTTGLYEYVVTGAPQGTLVEYRIEAHDSAGNHKVEDNSGRYYVYTVIPEFPPMLILSLLVIVTLLAAMASRRTTK